MSSGSATHEAPPTDAEGDGPPPVAQAPDTTAPRARRRPPRWSKSLLRVLGAVAVVAVIGAMVDGNAFWTGIATTAVISYVLTASFNLVFGYGGIFSLGHVALYGVGAYGSVILQDRYELDFVVASVLAIALAAFVGFLVALPTARLTGVFLALGTLAFAIAAEELFLKWTDVTGGAQGYLGIQPPELFGTELLGGTIEYYWFAAVFAVLTFEVLYRMSTSGFGRSLVALRESDPATRSVGIDPAKVRRRAFAVSGAFAGLAGVLFARYALFISPESFSLSKMIEVLVVTLLGGAGTVLGPVVGVGALVAIDEGGHELGDTSSLLYGLAIVLVISFAPHGFVGLFSSLRRRLFGARRAAKVEPGAVDVATVLPAAEQGDDRPSLRIDRVSLHFDGLVALDDVSFGLEPGEVLGLVGPNGAGKTSLVNVVSGMLPPAEGHAWLGDRDLIGLPAHEVARAGVVRTFQSTRLIPTFDLVTNVVLGRNGFADATFAEQVLLLPRSVHDDDRAREVALALLEVVGVVEHAYEDAADVPYGVARRAEIAKALAMEPAFLLLDEPGAGLSAFERSEVAEAIRSASERGVGCLLIDHNVPFVAECCSRIVVLATGTVLVEGPTADVLEHPEVIEAYLGRAGAR